MLHQDFPYLLYLVISEKDCHGKDFLKIAEQAILGGVDIIQLREKNCSTQDFIQKALRLKDITEKYTVPLIINDNLEVAKYIDASGIHVGNNDTPPTDIVKQWQSKNILLGYSLEYLEQLKKDDAKVANHFGVSPVFSTTTKTNTVKEWGLDGLAEIRALTTKPLVAIGNMHLKNVKAVRDAGANSIATISAICSAKNPKKAAYELKNELLK